jgi:FkbM family methyltransferase
MKMRRWLAPLRAPMEKVPIVADTYRLLRDYVKFRTSTPRELPLGFKLMGHPKMVSGNYELEETEVIGGALEHADVFVDVGANIGYYTCFARRRGKRVLAIEPSTTTLRFLYANLLANDIRDVEVIPVGLSDHVELATLYGTGGTASLIPGWSRVSAAYATVIPTTTLDHLLAGRFAGQRLFVKIDIEGAEYTMLRGAVETMDRPVAPTWFVEIYIDAGRGYRNEKFRDTFQLFWDHGYTAREATLGGAEVTRADVDRWVAAGRSPTPGANYLFSRR